MQVKRVILFTFVPGTIAGCAPSVTVENQTSFPVRVVVKAGVSSSVVSASPGESSTVEVSEGAY